MRKLLSLAILILDKTLTGSVPLWELELRPKRLGEHLQRDRALIQFLSAQRMGEMSRAGDVIARKYKNMCSETGVSFCHSGTSTLVCLLTCVVSKLI